MRQFGRQLIKAVLVGGGLFVLWLFAVWPPPVWYRSHWPAETAFQAMRRHSGTAAKMLAARDPVDRATLQREWCTDTTSTCAAAPLRLYRPVPLDSITDWMALAVTTGEDQRFRDHGGIDWVNLRRALGYPRDGFQWGAARDRNDLRRALGRAWERRDALRGASTLTQQLAKNLYLSPSRNPLRKVKEAVTAYRLEFELGKDRILELYLNVVEMGPEIWGTEAASRYYFGRSAYRLTLDQAALLAGLLPFPLRSNPLLRPNRMQWRQRLILRILRGEQVELPPVPEEEAAPPPVESLPPAPVDTTRGRDTLDTLPLDTVPVAPDSLRPPRDTVPRPPSDSAPPRKL